MAAQKLPHEIFDELHRDKTLRFCGLRVFGYPNFNDPGDIIGVMLRKHHIDGIMDAFGSSGTRLGMLPRDIREYMIMPYIYLLDHRGKRTNFLGIEHGGDYQYGVWHTPTKPWLYSTMGTDANYMHYGVYHREGAPAHIMYDANTIKYYKHGLLHRDDGPAVIGRNSIRYYRRGEPHAPKPYWPYYVYIGNNVEQYHFVQRPETRAIVTIPSETNVSIIRSNSHGITPTIIFEWRLDMEIRSNRDSTACCPYMQFTRDATVAKINGVMIPSPQWPIIYELLNAYIDSLSMPTIMAAAAAELQTHLGDPHFAKYL